MPESNAREELREAFKLAYERPAKFAPLVVEFEWKKRLTGMDRISRIKAEENKEMCYSSLARLNRKTQRHAFSIYPGNLCPSCFDSFFEMYHYLKAYSVVGAQKV